VALDISDLPDEVRTLIAAQAATIARQQAELSERQKQIALLRAQLAKLRRMHFGRSSERLGAEITQLELALEELEEQDAARSGKPAQTAPATEADVLKPARRPLPDHLPRDIVIHPTACACPRCGGELRRFGEDVTEVLDYRPATFRVIRHVRPKFTCRRCEAITQAPAPSLPIRRGRASAALLAHVLVSKFCDHLPLYRQSEIYSRVGVMLERSTLADWVGQSSALLRPLIDALEQHVMAGDRLYADDTPVPVLAQATVRQDRTALGLPARPTAVRLRRAAGRTLAINSNTRQAAA
jgi:transposase